MRVLGFDNDNAIIKADKSVRLSKMVAIVAKKFVSDPRRREMRFAIFVVEEVLDSVLVFNAKTAAPPKTLHMDEAGLGGEACR